MRHGARESGETFRERWLRQDLTSQLWEPIHSQTMFEQIRFLSFAMKNTLTAVLTASGQRNTSLYAHVGNGKST